MGGERSAGGISTCLCRFLDAGKKKAPQAQLTGVQKAPRHEVAGSWVPAEQRALWGFNAGAGLDDERDADRIRPACLHVWEVSGVQEAFRLVFGADQRAIHALMDAIGPDADFLHSLHLCPLL